MPTYDKLIYYRSDYSREAQKIEMEIPPNLTIAEFKIVCRRLAAATGYSPESITREFGKDKEVGNKKQLKLLFD
mgnify:CR=1 FL=1|tara:strand:- start:5948 stop:6169 length:222 start_codon:yes stop_codon:yes gene_type:complete